MSLGLDGFKVGTMVGCANIGDYVGLLRLYTFANKIAIQISMQVAVSTIPLHTRPIWSISFKTFGMP